MTLSVLVLAGGVTFAVVAAMVIVVLLVATRRPQQGVRRWVSQANDAWRNDRLEGTASVRDLNIDDLMQEATPVREGEADIDGLETIGSHSASATELPSYTPAAKRSRPGAGDQQNLDATRQANGSTSVDAKQPE